MASSDQYGNTYSLLMPKYLRKHYLKEFDIYDEEWQAWFMKMMPKKVGPGQGAKRHFTRPRRADPQGMATFHEPDEAIEPMNRPTVDVWNYNTRMLGNAFTRGKQEFKGDFEGDLLSRVHADMMKWLTQFINRAIEYTLTKFAYGESNIMSRFTDQDLDRQAIANLDSGEFNSAASDLQGHNWGDEANANPFKDLAFLKERYKYMANKQATYLMIGRQTEYKLEINDELKDRLIRIENTTQEILGDYLAGIELIKVVGQTYKDIPNAANNLGMPGVGDYSEHTWDNANIYDMMVETIGGNSWEWGVLGTSNIGEVSCGYVDEDHKAQRGNPTNIFVEQWQERNPKAVWTSAKMMFCPVVYDYADIMLLRKMAQQP